MTLKTRASGEVPQARKIWGFPAQWARRNSNIFQALVIRVNLTSSYDLWFSQKEHWKSQKKSGLESASAFQRRYFKICGTQCLQKGWHLTTISKILAGKLEHKPINGCVNATRSNWRFNLCVGWGKVKRMEQDVKLTYRREAWLRKILSVICFSWCWL